MRQIARSIRLVSVLALVVLGLGACVSPISIPAPPPPPRPTIGPVRDQAGGPGLASLELTSNTNCAEVGEVVTFTLTISNEMTYPITLTGTPVLDIIISPAAANVPKPSPNQRWSESGQYPSSVSPILAPHEVRIYKWLWKADSAYASQPEPQYNGVVVSASTAELRPSASAPRGNGTTIYLGIGTRDLSYPGAYIRCADMQH
jgi:uncharacterized repeat protein (TIGR01451 family)